MLAACFSLSSTRANIAARRSSSSPFTAAANTATT
jgi:hypothetical protein